MSCIANIARSMPIALFGALTAAGCWGATSRDTDDDGVEYVDPCRAITSPGECCVSITKCAWVQDPVYGAFCATLADPRCDFGGLDCKPEDCPPPPKPVCHGECVEVQIHVGQAPKPDGGTSHCVDPWADFDDFGPERPPSMTTCVGE